MVLNLLFLENCNPIGYFPSTKKEWFGSLFYLSTFSSFYSFFTWYSFFVRWDTIFSWTTSSSSKIFLIFSLSILTYFYWEGSLLSPLENENLYLSEESINKLVFSQLLDAISLYPVFVGSIESTHLSNALPFSSILNLRTYSFLGKDWYSCKMCLSCKFFLWMRFVLGLKI